MMAEVEKHPPTFKSVTLKMDGDEYRSLIAHANKEPHLDSGTAQTILDKIKMAVG